MTDERICCNKLGSELHLGHFVRLDDGRFFLPCMNPIKFCPFCGKPLQQSNDTQKILEDAVTMKLKEINERIGSVELNKIETMRGYTVRDILLMQIGPAGTLGKALSRRMGKLRVKAERNEKK